MGCVLRGEAVTDEQVTFRVTSVPPSKGSPRPATRAAPGASLALTAITLRVNDLPRAHTPAVFTAPTLVTPAATEPLPSPGVTAAAPRPPGLMEALTEETRARGTQAEAVLNPRHQISGPGARS